MLNWMEINYQQGKATLTGRIEGEERVKRFEKRIIHKYTHDFEEKLREFSEDLDTQLIAKLRIDRD
jgi:predicted HicB family RNase H-like nuclease